MLNGLAEIPETRSLFAQVAAELKKYLQEAAIASLFQPPLVSIAGVPYKI